MRPFKTTACFLLPFTYAMGCARESGTARAPEAAVKAHSVPLPAASGHASLDYMAFEPGRGRVWVPVGDTGSVDVLDPATDQFTRVDGFASTQREVRGTMRALGPSSAAVGDGWVYIGDRGSNEVCPIETATLKRAACVKLASAPDGVAYVASTKEVWVTTPSASSLTILDAAAPVALRVKATVSVPGSPEGYAVDDGRGIFFTNLEDKDRTLVIDVKAREITSTWSPGCGEKGPRGIAVDRGTRLVMVACTNHVVVMDGQSGAKLAEGDSGDGVDNIDWLASKRLLYVAAGRAATLTVLRVGERGEASVIAQTPTAEGVRNAVADNEGNAYLADPQHAAVWIVPSALILGDRR